LYEREGDGGHDHVVRAAANGPAFKVIQAEVICEVAIGQRLA
jgi:hypothetical protein